MVSTRARQKQELEIASEPYLSSRELIGLFSLMPWGDGRKQGFKAQSSHHEENFSEEGCKSKEEGQERKGRRHQCQECFSVLPDNPGPEHAHSVQSNGHERGC